MGNHLKYTKKKCLIVNVNGIVYTENGGISTNPKSILFCGKDAKRVRKNVQFLHTKYKRGPNTIKKIDKIQEIFGSIKSILREGRTVEPETINLDLKSEYDVDGNREKFTVAINGVGNDKEWKWDPRVASQFFQGIETKALYKL